MAKLQTRARQHSVDILFVLMLFCVLAFCALSVVIIGAGVYKDTINRMDDNFSSGTSLTYITNKIRQNDVGGAVYVGEIEGVPALILERSYNLSEFQTYIYHNDGYIKEVMVRKGEEVRLNDGLSIIEVSRMTIDQEQEGLLRFTAQNKDGASTSVLVALRSQPLEGTTFS